MSNPTFRWLDDPPKLAGLTFSQWLWLVLGGGSLGALLHFLHVPLQPAVILLIFVVGIPTALAVFGENVGPGINALLADAMRWRRHPHQYDPAAIAGYKVGLVVLDDDAPKRRRLSIRRARATHPSTPGDAT
jgi:hypothetical protein